MFIAVKQRNSTAVSATMGHGTSALDGIEKTLQGQLDLRQVLASCR